MMHSYMYFIPVVYKQSESIFTIFFMTRTTVSMYSVDVHTCMYSVQMGGNPGGRGNGGHVPPPQYFGWALLKPLNNYCWLCAFSSVVPPPTLTRNRRRWMYKCTCTCSLYMCTLYIFMTHGPRFPCTIPYVCILYSPFRAQMAFPHTYRLCTHTTQGNSLKSSHTPN